MARSPEFSDRNHEDEAVNLRKLMEQGKTARKGTDTITDHGREKQEDLIEGLKEYNKKTGVDVSRFIKQLENARGDSEVHEVEAKMKQQDENFTGAVTHYAKTIEDLNSKLVAANSRGLRINTKATSCDRNAMSSKTEVSKTDNGSSGEIYVGAELADENRKRLDRTTYEIDLGAAACKEMAEFVKREFELR